MAALLIVGESPSSVSDHPEIILETPSEKARRLSVETVPAGTVTTANCSFSP